MSSLRCTLCGINYPLRQEFVVCPIHEEETTKVKDDHDPDWDTKAKALYTRLVSDSLRPFPRVEGVEVVEEDGRLYVRQADLVAAKLNINVIGPSFRLFEIDDWVYETQGWHEGGRRWWVERVGPKLEITSE